ncbi:hypothetical protein [Dyadobacter sp.]|uniref:hypothetical protein n=1 Tax=Dyadobacter sp. TaxID=1914288 RepID=UPI003F6ECF22
MGYITTKTAISIYTPTVFIKQDREFNGANTNRIRWLERQLINIEYGIYQYNASLLDLSNQAAQLDGKSDAAQWMSAVGAIALNLGMSGLSESSNNTAASSQSGVAIEGDFAKYSALAGAALIAAGIVINIFKKKKDDKALQELYQDSLRLAADVKLLESLRLKYQSELNRAKLLPILLFGTAAFIVRNN